MTAADSRCRCISYQSHDVSSDVLYRLPWMWRSAMQYLGSQPVACDILPYWQQKAEVWPRLCSVARNLLSVPAASTSSERLFSVAGRTIEDRR